MGDVLVDKSSLAPGAWSWIYYFLKEKYKDNLQNNSLGV